MTWLMIKQHNDTGLKYFHKTDKKDPNKYLGSGLYWLRHLKEHGRNVSTIWAEEFTPDEVEEVATFISEELNIVDNKEWANLKIENGLDGGSDGSQFKDREISLQERSNLSERMKKENPMHNAEAKDNHLKAMRSDSRREKLSKAKKGNTNVRGKSWFNNGVKSGMFFECPVGWNRGRLNPHWNHKRKRNVEQ
jgi:hypothetical protein